MGTTTINGTYTSATIFTTNNHSIENYAKAQLQMLCDNETAKGAISAQTGEKVIIPINMRDGILLGTGLGNTEWNCTAPHGSGRIMKREDIKNHYTLSSFKASMKGII